MNAGMLPTWGDRIALCAWLIGAGIISWWLCECVAPWLYLHITERRRSRAVRAAETDRAKRALARGHWKGLP